MSLRQHLSNSTLPFPYRDRRILPVCPFLFFLKVLEGVGAFFQEVPHIVPHSYIKIAPLSAEETSFA